jgi:hypothetical protein
VGDPAIGRPAKLERALAHVPPYDGKRRLGRADNLMATLTAHHLLERLERSGYIIMQREAGANGDMAAAAGPSGGLKEHNEHGHRHS